MALISCPECGKEVSDKAPTCPNCGVPIARPVLSHEDLTDERITAILEDGIAEFASDGWYVHQRGFGYASLQKKTGFLHRGGLAMWVEDDGTLEVKLMGEAGPLGVRRYERTAAAPLSHTLDETLQD